MPVYATAADAATHEPDLAAAVTGPALDALLAAAERDVDALLGPFAPVLTGPAAGFKLDPALLMAHERVALARAVCAQAAHRKARGTLLDAPAAKSVKGPDFERVYADPVPGQSGRYSPRIGTELGPLRARLAYSARARA